MRVLRGGAARPSEVPARSARRTLCDPPAGGSARSVELCAFQRCSGCRGEQLACLPHRNTSADAERITDSPSMAWLQDGRAN